VLYGRTGLELDGPTFASSRRANRKRNAASCAASTFAGGDKDFSR
jgi:hypothetical protein